VFDLCRKRNVRRFLAKIAGPQSSARFLKRNHRNRFALGLPYLCSIWLTHSLHGRIEGQLKGMARAKSPRSC